MSSHSNQIHVEFTEAFTGSKTYAVPMNSDKSTNKCVEGIEKQIKMQITTALKYLSMVAYFSRDDVNRPGFANFFLEAANKDREHAIVLIEFLNVRGQYFKDDKQSFFTSMNINSMVKESEGPKVFDLVLTQFESSFGEKATDGLNALKNALQLETKVTKSIRELIVNCDEEAQNVGFLFQMVDKYFTNGRQQVKLMVAGFLEQQFKGQQSLAQMVSTLGLLVRDQGSELAEFLYDKQLL